MSLWTPGEPLRPIAELDLKHLARHVEIEHPCNWNPADSLDDGCVIRYRIYREAFDLPFGHSFPDWFTS